MKKLIRGILDFRKNVLPHRRDLFVRLAAGQSPDTILITCSDSRVAPNWFASTDPGELFVVRNVGNIVPPYQEHTGDDSLGAALEFALANLKITDIIVCGHSGCGAFHAVAMGLDKLPPSNLKSWLKVGENVLKDSPLVFDAGSKLNYEDKLSQTSALQQVENLRTYPAVQKKIQEGKLKLHAWWFNIADAGVHCYIESKRKFILIDEESADLLPDL